MEELQVGYAKYDITPAIGCFLQGNGNLRLAQRINDPLFVRCVIFENQGTAVLLYFDLCGMRSSVSEEIRTMVAQRVGCERKDVFICCTHTHVGPNVVNMSHYWDEQYIEDLKHIACQAARTAKNDLCSAKMSYAKDTLTGISFVRRYRMKDGSVKTNPKKLDPNILHPMNDPDYGIQLLKITRENGPDVALVNFSCHATVVDKVDGEYAVSADYPGQVCAALEQALPDTVCVYCNGTCGDVTQTNRMSEVKTNGINHARFMGQTIAGKILSMCEKAEDIAVGPVRTAEIEFNLPMKEPTEEQLKRAEEIMALGDMAKGECKVPVTEYFEARTFLWIKKLNGIALARVTGFCIGEFSLVGFPGEPFCEIGKQVKAKSPFDLQFALHLTNGGEGYFPMKDAFEVDGYESRTTRFRAGVGETMIDVALKLLAELKNEK